MQTRDCLPDQLDLFAEMDAEDHAARLASAPTLFDTAQRGYFARVGMFEQWVTEYGHFDCNRLSHGWHIAYATIRGDRAHPTSQCRPAILAADLRCEHFGDGDCACVGSLLYRGACLHCDWESDTCDTENGAAEAAHDHSWPGWRELPITPRIPEAGTSPKEKAAQLRWLERVNSLYPAEWLETGGPVRTRRQTPGTRHVPLRTPYGGYDMCGEVDRDRGSAAQPIAAQPIT